MKDMSAATKTPARKASADSDAPKSKAPMLPFRRPRRVETPVDRERRRLKEERRGPLREALNVAKTFLAVLAWTVLGGVHVIVVAPYVSYVYAQGALFGMAVSSAILLHLWPPRTAPWRTLFWMFWLTGIVGSTLLMLGAGRMALTGATIAGFGFLLLRMNENGRKLARLVQDWRTLR